MAPQGSEPAPVCLGQLWVFRDLAPTEREVLAGRARRRRFTEGQSVFTQGDEADEMFLLKCGRVKLSRFLENGSEIILDIRKAGDVIGEMVLGEAGSYPVDAVCLEPVMTCGFSRKEFEEIVLAHPNIGLQIIRNLSARLALLTEKVGDMAAGGLGERLLRLLAGLAAEHGSPGTGGGRRLPFVLTHEELGFLVGAHRVSVTRAMQELRKTGQIRQEGRSLVVMAAPG